MLSIVLTVLLVLFRVLKAEQHVPSANEALFKSLLKVSTVRHVQRGGATIMLGQVVVEKILQATIVRGMRAIFHPANQDIFVKEVCFHELHVKQGSMLSIKDR